MALPLVVGACFTSCKEDTQPRLETPTEFVLNTPALGEQTYIFRDDENYQNLNDITFTVSQPNYGVGCVPNYTVQIAKSEEDFTAWEDAMKAGEIEDGNAILDGDGLPLAYTLELSTSLAQITVPGEQFCSAVNTLYGFDADNYNHETVPVAVRVHAAISNAPQSEIWSNPIVVNVSSYIPVSEPGKLYLIGQPTGWDINADGVYLEETGIGTKIFYGNVYIAAGEFQFRFYSQLGDWESWAVGSQDADEPVDVSFDAEGVYEGPIFMSAGGSDSKGKGSWEDTSWEGGNLEITINTKDMTIKMQKSEGKKVYVVGACQDWNIDNDAIALKETPAGSNVYSGTFTVDSGAFMFRIYTQLGSWDNGSIGADGEGNPEISLPYMGNAIVGGQANWTVSTWAGGDVTVTLDMNSNTVDIQAN